MTDHIDGVPVMRSASFRGEDYRTTLSRDWTPDADELPAPGLLFVMLNPSTADALVDDPTIRRCIGFARREGFTRLDVMNLYSYRATNPADLWLAADPVGPGNDYALQVKLTDSLQLGDPVIAAWGVNARPDRVAHVLGMVDGVNWRALGLTKDGHPRHPLYVRSDAPLVPFDGRA